jgi:hypothetical protein
MTEDQLEQEALGWPGEGDRMEAFHRCFAFLLIGVA